MGAVCLQLPAEAANVRERSTGTDFPGSVRHPRSIPLTSRTNRIGYTELGREFKMEIPGTMARGRRGPQCVPVVLTAGRPEVWQ
jgi:hypothetical protein